MASSLPQRLHTAAGGRRSVGDGDNASSWVARAQQVRAFTQEICIVLGGIGVLAVPVLKALPIPVALPIPIAFPESLPAVRQAQPV